MTYVYGGRSGTPRAFRRKPKEVKVSAFVANRFNRRSHSYCAPVEMKTKTKRKWSTRAPQDEESDIEQRHVLSIISRPSYPRVNNITTDIMQPLLFVFLVRRRERRTPAHTCLHETWREPLISRVPYYGPTHMSPTRDLREPSIYLEPPLYNYGDSAGSDDAAPAGCDEKDGTKHKIHQT